SAPPHQGRHHPRHQARRRHLPLRHCPRRGRARQGRGGSMSALTVFTYTDEREVRTVERDGEAWFVAADVAAILGYSATEAMTRSMDADEKDLQVLHTPGGDQRVTVISEPGLYEAI